MHKAKLLLLTLLSLFLFGAVKTSAYGFGFKKNNDHMAPDIGIYAKEIADTNSYYKGNSQDKVLYLTFDAGYDNGNLSKILDVLNEKNVKGTFFVTGDFVNRESMLLKRIVSDGHLVGNHSYNHKNITKITEAEIKEEVSKLEDAYYNVTGSKISNYFRPPEGEFNKESLQVISKLGYKTFFWSIAYNDWNTEKQHGSEYGYKMIMDNLHNGAIILMHTVSSDNASCLGKVIDDAIKQGYEFRNLDKFNE